MEKNIYMKEEKILAAFKMMDLNGDGKITKEEIKAVLGSNFSKSNLYINIYYIN